MTSTSSIVRSKQALVWKQLTERQALSPAATVLCEYLFQKYSDGFDFDGGEHRRSPAGNSINSYSRPRSCLELTTAESPGAGIVGIYSAASFKIPALTVAGINLTASLGPADGRIGNDDHNWIPKNLDAHRNLLDSNVTTNTVTKFDWDDEKQVRKMRQLASPTSTIDAGYDWILLANTVLTSNSMHHQPLADLIATLLRQQHPTTQPATTTTSSLNNNSKCFVAHEEGGSYNLRGYDYQLAELERALLRAGLVTLNVSHHRQQEQVHQHQNNNDHTMENAKTCAKPSRRRKVLRKTTPPRPNHHKSRTHSSNRVCILEIGNSMNSQASAKGGSGTALWREM